MHYITIMPATRGTPVRVTESERLKNRTFRMKDRENARTLKLASILNTVDVKGKPSAGRLIVKLVEEKFADPTVKLAEKEFDRQAAKR